VTIGQGVLDEDWGDNEVYDKLLLTNLSSLVQVSKKTSEIAPDAHPDVVAKSLKRLCVESAVGALQVDAVET
jgi:hypothetical protein